jgi:hypothetical protein
MDSVGGMLLRDPGGCFRVVKDLAKMSHPEDRQLGDRTEESSHCLRSDGLP